MNEWLQRKLLRLQGYDYSQSGGYYITVCTQHRMHLLGDIVDGVMILNDVGYTVETAWLDLTTHYPHIILDTFVIMPNHLHGIILIQTDVGVRFIEPASKPVKRIVNEAGVINHAPTLGKIIRTFKAKSTFSANRLESTSGTSLWQRGYYDRIIRDETELSRIRAYIFNNPAQWESDEYNIKK